MLHRARTAARAKLVRALEEVVGGHLDAAEERARARHDELRDELGRTRDELRTAVTELERRRRHDLLFAAEVAATAQTAELIAAELPTARWFPSPHDTLRHGLSLVDVDGMALEFGVASGTTLALLVEGLPGRTPVGFDSFAGLPEDWRSGFHAGAFAQDPPDVPGAELVVGLFADTLPGFLAEHPGPVAFCHVDCDLGSATATVLEHVGPRLVAGSVIVFDEYFGYPGWRDGEHRAWTEHVARTGLEFTYEGYTIDHEQLVVRVTDPGHAPPG